ncbi:MULTISPECIES: hypothetical protein [unclassified Modicisalibacter]|uniref:hypothetical protein n=1 Tax=unclassified Modicisalibacter TaxID=2679913 RepID=UPI001CCE3698|nr:MULTISPECIES: hypothetical protein [unclassified Modicisalibacter]MBZ9556818.1 hypothetical protein [Modicisalibacter sp. R2A 31.J]MBZ9574712.1 hypothetical protein [Modicisalibacter sp. MOD 31.J]
MTQSFDVDGFINARKQTRVVSDILKVQAADYLATLAPLVRPQPLFGEYLQGAPRGSGRETQHHFKEFRTLFDTHASARPFNLLNELEVPLNIINSTPELFPLEYDHTLQDGSRVRVLSPVRWVVGYASFDLGRFRQVVHDPNRSGSELHRFVLHYLMLFHCFSRAGGLGRLLKGLRFPLSFQRLDDFGELPFCVISSPVASTLPDDGVIRHSTEISGSRSFEELIPEAAIDAMQDDLREQLIGALRGSDAP